MGTHSVSASNVERGEHDAIISSSSSSSPPLPGVDSIEAAGPPSGRRVRRARKGRAEARGVGQAGAVGLAWGRLSGRPAAAKEWRGFRRPPLAAGMEWAGFGGKGAPKAGSVGGGSDRGAPEGGRLGKARGRARPARWKRRRRLRGGVASDGPLVGMGSLRVSSGGRRVKEASSGSEERGGPERTSCCYGGGADDGRRTGGSAMGGEGLARGARARVDAAA
ncbi:uncharacterized protein A4U43_C02F13450 [Asparagus officinalis]|uniref:Uncharacterized protein n=1 Tax=Asparagus officinalis TaxID=4686 RepID=A0A5P1FM38_ASPOF|nr:uncharacterized protein A4U43_C02F13450 [Asparagus officinalis]